MYSNCHNTDNCIAIYAATSRGRIQLIYGGQPFIFEKILKLATGEEKKFWRCNQWWNQKCRSRVYTINDIVVPLNRYHTHEDIVKRKKRTRRIPIKSETTTTTTTTTIEPANTMSSASTKMVGGMSAAQTKYTTSSDLNVPATIDVSELGMHLKYEEIVAQVTEIPEAGGVIIAINKDGKEEELEDMDDEK